MEKSERKCDETAMKHKDEGVKYFNENDYFDALLSFNKCLCFAILDQLKSLAFANRGLVYYKLELYDLCLENIKLARDHQYPIDKMVKLDDRERKCIELLESKVPTQNYFKEFFEISDARRNENISFIIDGLEMKRDQNFGRGIYTKTDLKAGEIIAAEEIFTLSNMEPGYRRCCFCYKTAMLNLIPCLFQSKLT